MPRTRHSFYKNKKKLIMQDASKQHRSMPEICTVTNHEPVCGFLLRRSAGCGIGGAAR
jgi:hypothetical protein